MSSNKEKNQNDEEIIEEIHVVAEIENSLKKDKQEYEIETNKTTHDKQEIPLPSKELMMSNEEYESETNKTTHNKQEIPLPSKELMMSNEEYESETNKTTQDKQETQVPSKTMMSNEEYEIETKKTTHDALLKLGEINEKQKTIESCLKFNIEKKKNILNKYNFKPDEINDYVEELSKNKDMLLIKIQSIVQNLAFIRETDNEIIIYYEKIIKTQKTDLDSMKEETDDLKTENEDLEINIEKKDEEIENNWKTRVHKLRTKISDNRQFINYQYFILGFTNIHTCIFSLFGYQAYFNFWYVLYEWLNFIIYNIIFFIPNMFQILTNFDNYTYLYVLTMKLISNLGQHIFQNTHDGLEIMINYSVHNCVYIYELFTNIHINTIMITLFFMLIFKRLILR
jgi:hypothetical protein